MNYKEFQDKYEDEWKKGNISEESVDELFDIINTANIDRIIANKIHWTICDMIPLMIQYRLKKNQSYLLIEPIRVDNWSLHTWYSIYPKAIEEEFSADKDSLWNISNVESAVYNGLRLTYGNDCYYETAGDELIKELIEEFTAENLCSIDYVENYLKKYAKTDKIRRCLQLV